MNLTLEEAQEIVGSIGHASKMPCYTYSLPAKNCHTGSQLREIPNSVCSKCYALRGNFARPTVIAHMEKRLRSINDPKWVDAMVLVIQKLEYSGVFRWHASGDIQNLGHLIKIAEIARRLPKITFWLPTRELPILNAYVNAGFKFPKNLIVRLSAAMIEAQPPKEVMKRLGVLGSAVSKEKWDCPASSQNNQCLDCRRCWDKNVPIVTYKYH